MKKNLNFYILLSGFTVSLSVQTVYASIPATKKKAPVKTVVAPLDHISKTPAVTQAHPVMTPLQNKTSLQSTVLPVQGVTSIPPSQDATAFPPTSVIPVASPTVNNTLSDNAFHASNSVSPDTSLTNALSSSSLNVSDYAGENASFGLFSSGIPPAQDFGTPPLALTKQGTLLSVEASSQKPTLTKKQIERNIKENNELARAFGAAPKTPKETLFQAVLRVSQNPETWPLDKKIKMINAELDDYFIHDAGILAKIDKNTVQRHEMIEVDPHTKKISMRPDVSIHSACHQKNMDQIIYAQCTYQYKKHHKNLGQTILSLMDYGSKAHAINSKKLDKAFGIKDPIYIHDTLYGLSQSDAKKLWQAQKNQYVWLGKGTGGDALLKIHDTQSASAPGQKEALLKPLQHKNHEKWYIYNLGMPIVLKKDPNEPAGKRITVQLINGADLDPHNTKNLHNKKHNPQPS